MATTDQAGARHVGPARRPTGAPGRARAWEWLRIDVLPALIVAAGQLGGTLAASRHQPDRASLDALGVLLLLAGPAALVVRRRRPEVALGVAFAATLAYWLQDYPRGPVFLSLVIAFLSVVLRGRRAVAWGSLAVGYVAFAWIRPLYSDEPWPSLAQALGLAAWLLVLGTVAEIIRARRERAAELAHTRVEEARRRASEERLRIARELHDVLAHNISLINVQAGVALHLLDERPEQARPALAAIKDASKDALGELRSVLDVLRHGEDGAPAPRTPTAGLGDLAGVVERTRAAGLDVALEVEGEARSVPAGVDLAALRIVQEALTNVVRHSGARRATVRLTYGDANLRVQVDDDGHGGNLDARDHGFWPRDRSPDRANPSPEAEPGSGRGIAGMRERVQALGGQFEAGPRPGRGFRVRARLPIGPGAGSGTGSGTGEAAP